ncbi:MAG: cytochrome C oxidase subunit IV family protein [Actinomycetota bacterium]|nr:cytochrome C oxidase subunit IV family protein [Actinomycetota bacterium]
METHREIETTHLEHEHPKERVYVKVAIVLGIITAVEIWLSYTHYPNWIKVVALLVLSIAKFSAVVGYFMHLKFDNPTLRKPFLGGLFLALSVYTAVLLMFTLKA